MCGLQLERDFHEQCSVLHKSLAVNSPGLVVPLQQASLQQNSSPYCLYCCLVPLTLHPPRHDGRLLAEHMLHDMHVRADLSLNVVHFYFLRRVLACSAVLT